ncbi:major type 1 subunit fimbrin (pilin) [Kosakonia arachidis]|uniref:Major type 1 subunit fimbrin (Pilin) n=1 Tax=Kosakonia arachidis TaxID=551989 RepID=A0A1I6XJJ6_9ENTR|nr:fimbrial protein [Kosakonia arachidis]SFT38273.1 major type 1 subunit fimbrin (pilin) [Kosakonia arachidis]
MASLINKSFSAVLMVCSGLALAASDSSSITFNGKVLANTCTLSSGSKEQVITLSDIADRDIKGKGTTGGETEVNMVLRDCGAAATAVMVTAWGEADNDDTSAFRNAKAEGEGATGVGLYFYQTDGRTKFKPDGLIKERSTLTPSANNTLIYKAAYVGTKDAVVAGEFSTVVNMSFEYQ